MSDLQVDVYVAPAIPAVTGFDDPSKQLFSPTSSTLIQGPTSAVLVDTPISIEQTNGLADWVETKLGANKTLRYVYTTHAHGDHFFGNVVIRQRFPGAEFVATGRVVDGVAEFLAQHLPQWQGMFPNGQIPDGQFVPSALPADGAFTVDGHRFLGVDVAHADTHATSFLHVPDARLVVGGDIVYGDYQQYLGEADTPAKRRLWVEALDQIAALRPAAVVPGHKKPDQPYGPELVRATKEYILTFERELERLADADKLEESMKKLYPDRLGGFILAFTCQLSVASYLAEKAK